MTEEEAAALEEFVTANPPRVNPAKARHAVRAAADVSADYRMAAPQSNEQSAISNEQ
jgi:hypothetical protein